MITYKVLWPDLPNVKLPVLHKIVYGNTFSQAGRDWGLHEFILKEWCFDNCKASFYFHPGYTNERFVEFEDDADAMLFALRWL